MRSSILSYKLFDSGDVQNRNFKKNDNPQTTNCKFEKRLLTARKTKAGLK